ncbi:MAG TPA: hypothetical protein VFV17_00530, partial [Usitatibacteraceae bacterium]|nr:hypothetical protein [Usitatibacteraceae bacterium]
TRRINIYADKTLLAAYAQGTHNVTVDHVRAAIADTRIIMEPAPSRPLWRPVALAAVLGLAAGLAAGWFAALQFAAVPAKPVETPTLKAGNAQPANELPLAPAGASPIAKTTDPTAGSPPKTEPLAEAAVAQPLKPPAVSAGAAAPSASAVTAVPPIDAAQTPAGSARVPVESASPQRIVPAAAGSAWLDERIARDASRLARIESQAYFVQLMSADARDREAIVDFVRAASKLIEDERLLLVPVGSPENPRVNLLVGPFAGFSDASAELPRIPPRLSSFRPYVRNLLDIRARTRAGA